MQMDYAEGRRPRFDVGRVIERTFGAIGGNAVTLLLAAAIFVAIPQGFWGVTQVRLMTTDGVDFGPVNFLTWGVGWIVSLVCSVMMQGVATHAAVSDLQGRKATFQQCLGVAFRTLLPLIGLGILVGLGVMAGIILLIVPGIILMLMWSVAAPVLIAERKGVLASMGRSRDLSRNNRGMILLLFVIYVVVSWVFGMVFGLFSAGAMAASQVDFLFLQAVILSPIAAALLSILSAAGVAALYVELRTVKEGSGTGRQEIAAIFD
jgi:hypothetical protein